MRAAWLTVGCAVLAACGSEVKPVDVLVELDVDEQQKVCENYAFSAPVLETCGAPIPVRLEPLDIATCADVWMPRDPDCTATVSDWDACQDALAGDPCLVQSGTDACSALEACGIHVWSSALGLGGDTRFDVMVESEIRAVCEVINDYDAYAIPCEDTPDVLFDPSQGLCTSFGFGGCGDIGQVLDCQLDLMLSGDEVCEGFPESCVFDDC